MVDHFFRTGVIDEALIEADLTQVGFLGVSAIFPPGTSTLGVTYTLFWEDAAGNLTDIDGNGKIDIAFREIYYNDQYNWADNGVEGTIGRQDGLLVAHPRAVMNAIYGGTLRDLTGRGVGAHCGNWAQWPVN